MGNEKNFNFLTQIINNTKEKLILNEDIKLSGFSEKFKFKEGIRLKKDKFIIDGKGHSIDANGNSRIFQILQGKSIVLENIIFKNGKGDYGGALRNEGNLELINCKFENNNAKKNGCDISNTPGGKVKIFNCEFSPKSDAIWNRNEVQIWESQIDEIEKYVTGGNITTYNLGDGPEFDETETPKSILDNKRLDVFISFKSDDSQITNDVYEYLKDKRIKCWMSEKDIGGGVNFGKEIVDALDNVTSVLLIYSKNTPKSEWVNRELYYAARNSVHIFPFIVDDSSDIANEIAFIISSHNWIFLQEDKENSFKKIIAERYNFLHLTKNM